MNQGDFEENPLCQLRASEVAREEFARCGLLFVFDSIAVKELEANIQAEFKFGQKHGLGIGFMATLPTKKPSCSLNMWRDIFSSTV